MTINKKFNNQFILTRMISTALMLESENGSLTHKKITDRALKLRKCLAPLYPVTDEEWETILRGIADYADYLL